MPNAGRAKALGGNFPYSPCLSRPKKPCSAVTPLQTLSVARFPLFLRLGVVLSCPNGHALIMASFRVPCCSRLDTCQPSLATSMISLSVLQEGRHRGELVRFSCCTSLHYVYTAHVVVCNTGVLSRAYLVCF